MEIREVIPDDSGQIADIYNYYILNTKVTFETEPLTPESMKDRIHAIIPDYPWYVIRDGQILGFLYLSQYKSRCAYRKTAELTIYIRHGYQGRGLGNRLFSCLFSSDNRQPFHSVVSGIALPNPASIHLHEKFGFDKVAHFRQIGFKFGEWIDVEYWQKIVQKTL